MFTVQSLLFSIIRHLDTKSTFLIDEFKTLLITNHVVIKTHDNWTQIFLLTILQNIIG